jgi:hypothetical protein
LPDTAPGWGLGCQLASSQDRIFARFLLFRAFFLLVLYCFDSFLKWFRHQI